jgi:hypothetical protein
VHYGRSRAGRDSRAGYHDQDTTAAARSTSPADQYEHQMMTPTGDR